MASFTYTITMNNSIPEGLILNKAISAFGVPGGTVTGVSVTLSGLAHSYMGDLDILLVSPDDRKLMILSDVGDGTYLDGAPITLSDTGTGNLPLELQPEPLDPGSYKPFTTNANEVASDFGLGGSAIVHATGSSATGFAATLNGAPVNGNWTLFLRDDATGDTGSIGGWSITLQTNVDYFSGGGSAGNDTLIIVPGAVAGSGQIISSLRPAGGPIRFTGVNEFNIVLGGGNDYAVMGTGDDVLTGGEGTDLMYGGAGNDTFVIRSNDLVYGEVYDAGTGTDFLNTSKGDHGSFDFRGVTLVGFDYVFMNVDEFGINERIIVSASQIGTGLTTNCIIEGASSISAVDTFEIRMDGAASFNLASTLTFVNFGERVDSVDLIGTRINETLGGNHLRNVISGRAGNDSLSGRGGIDVISGGRGNDTVAGGTGGDNLYGGDGYDTLDYSASGASVLVRVFNGTGAAGDALGDTFTGFERVVGSAFGDSLIGSDPGNEALVGGGGGDYLNGLAGADRLDGGAGNDTLVGGNGADQYVFAAGYGQDRVLQFVDGVDKVDLIGLTFAQLTETAIAGGVRVAIATAPGTYIDLIGVTTAQVTSADFI
jgi:Ca2+-binding RTX toxin-like protein